MVIIILCLLLISSSTFTSELLQELRAKNIENYMPKLVLNPDESCFTNLCRRTVGRETLLIGRVQNILCMYDSSGKLLLSQHFIPRLLGCCLHPSGKKCVTVAEYHQKNKESEDEIQYILTVFNLLSSKNNTYQLKEINTIEIDCVDFISSNFINEDILVLNINIINCSYLVLFDINTFSVIYKKMIYIKYLNSNCLHVDRENEELSDGKRVYDFSELNEWWEENKRIYMITQNKLADFDE